MAIVESAAVASIISKLLSMSTDLIERKESREVMKEIREIQKLTIELHTLYTKIESKHHEIESGLQDKLFESQSKITQLEKDNFYEIREKDNLLKRLDEWDQYERKVGQYGFVFFAHKTELHVYACAVCHGKEPNPVILQPVWNMSKTMSHQCKTCKAQGRIE